jgi:hypothetical protein
MARYVSLHTLYHLDRQAAQNLAERLRAAQGLKVQRALINLAEGKLLLDWEAPDRETIERWMTAEGYEPADWLVLMEYEIKDGQMTTV